MNKQKTLSISIILLLIISLVAAIISSVHHAGNNNNLQDDRTPAEIYTDAANKILQASDLSLSISTAKITTRDGEVYEENSNQTLLYNNIGKETMQAHSRQMKSYGNYQITIQSGYKDSTAFYAITGGNFKCPATSEEYMATNLPAVLLDASLYESIEIEPGSIFSTMTFTKPTAAESWALPQGGKLIDASGTAKLSSDGFLQTVYQLTYQLNGAKIKEISRVEANATKPTITIPNTENYLPVKDINSLLLMEQSVGYLHQVNTITATTKQTIKSEVTGHNWNQESLLYFYDNGNHCTVRQDITTKVIDLGSENASAKKTQSIVFKDGKYTSTVDSGKPVEQTGVTDDSMRTYCRDNLVSTILMSKYITSITAKETETAIELSFTANEEMANSMCQNAWQILFGNPDYIRGLTTVSMTGHITIDKISLLPLKSGVSYDGTYNVSGHNYHLIFNAEQNYALSDDSN